MKLLLTASVLAGAFLFLAGMALRGEKPCAEMDPFSEPYGDL